MAEPLTACNRPMMTALGLPRGQSSASHDGEAVTCESDRDEMAIWWLETEWSEVQTR